LKDKKNKQKQTKINKGATYTSGAFCLTDSGKQEGIISARC
jgi:hypothetical protein